ncbi:extracellular solute-binding protein [Paenibacillus odorifer]|uniref:extracellular solute-binding protein n=1 Tax=Paenibacillus odorifer TaxID=189426 RepID=UPI00096E4A3E|nr:extracellular solute-binding protein [Paenibacillus odorifer]OME10769.1 hypothetical protein BSK60_24015 [Paenibacillus odorifer]
MLEDVIPRLLPEWKVYFDFLPYAVKAGCRVYSHRAAQYQELSTDVKKGKQYRVPTSVTMAGIFYNKKFSELGLKEALTWDAFKSILEMVKEKNPEITPMFIDGIESRRWGI